MSGRGLRHRRHNERGAALIESAIALPVALLTLYGVLYGTQLGTINERVQSAVRYTGVLATQAQPYHDYSLYMLYNGLGANAPIMQLPCPTPPPDVLSGGSDIAGQSVAVAQFFRPARLRRRARRRTRSCPATGFRTRSSCSRAIRP